MENSHSRGYCLGLRPLGCRRNHRGRSEAWFADSRLELMPLPRMVDHCHNIQVEHLWPELLRNTRAKG